MLETSIATTDLESASSSAEYPATDGALTAQPPKLNHAQLARAQAETLAAPRRSYGFPARLLFAALDLFYGKPRTLSKFKVLELVARVPYQAWEQTAYVAITHVHGQDRTGLPRRIYNRVLQARAEQDNEQWHLFILDEQI
jgi:hypothetical protein